MPAWKPIADYEQEPDALASDSVRQLDVEWQARRASATRPGTSRSRLDRFLEENARAWSIQTGRIEGLYDLTRGLTEQLVERGFEAVVVGRGESTLSAKELAAHLQDQRRGLDMVFDAVAGRRPLSNGLICEWHACITRSQDVATGATPDGRRVEVPLLKGKYKLRPNNPITVSGELHEYCPPEQVRSEMDRLLAMHEAHADHGVPTEVEAAWLHHRFVQIHPFQDGNGRVARALVAYLYARRHWPPPVIDADARHGYFAALQAADEGDLRPFVQFLAVRTVDALIAATRRLGVSG